jgi:hypothetical protein
METMAWDRTTSVSKLKTVLASYAIVGSLAGACYNDKSPLLPPCDGSKAVWPEPCADRKVDAGADARDSATEGGFR